MQSLTITALLSLSACASLFSPIPPPGKGGGSEVKEDAPVEIDFSPLPKDGKPLMLDKNGQATYEIHLVVETADDTTFEESYTVGEGTSPRGVRETVIGSFGDDWKLERVGDDKLIVRAYKDSLVRKAEIKVERIPRSMTPTIRRLSEKAKDK